MKREILFRGKRVDTGEWVEGDLIHGVNHKKGKVFILEIKGGVQSLSSGIDPIDGWSVIPETVGQFTGLTDKNGDKIFEGDIITYNFKTKFSNDAFTSTIQFEEFMWITDEHSINRLNNIKITGNIHDK